MTEEEKKIIGVLVDRATSKEALMDDRGFSLTYRCPVCLLVLNNLYNFCPECGQAIKFKERRK